MIRDRGAVYAELEEQVVDIGLGTIRSGHDRDLARQRMGAADAVDLAGVGRSHDAQQEVVAFVLVSGEVFGDEIGALGRAPTHDHAANPCSI